MCPRSVPCARIGSTLNDLFPQASKLLLSLYQDMGLRRIAEGLSRGVVLRRRVPPEFGSLPIYVSPEASLHYWFPSSRFDAMLYRMARELVRHGDSVWDVGANVGLFSVCASAMAGQFGSVLAIEPDIWLCHLLSKTSAVCRSYGDAAPINVLCAAISFNSRITQLEIAERSRAANHLADSPGSTQTNNTRISQKSLTVSLDFLMGFFPLPSVLKIDVETHEFEVLRGAERLIETARPTIWCEVSPENSVNVFNFLREREYDLFPAAIPASQRVALTKRASWDTLAIPKHPVGSEVPTHSVN